MNKRRALVSALVTMAVAWGLLGATLAAGATPRLGLDLQGGFAVRLVAPEGTDTDVLDKAVEIMRQRIEALGGVQEPEIAVAGDNAVEVQLPGVTDRDRALAAIGSTGDLSFRQVIQIGPLPGVSPVYAEFGLDPPGLDLDPIVSEGEGEDTTTTTTTAPPDEALVPTTPALTVAIDCSGGSPAGIDTAAVLPVETFDTVDPDTGLTLIDDPAADAWLLEPDSGLIYHVGPALLTGADLSGASAEFGGGSVGAGGWVVDPSFTGDGGEKFRCATGALASFNIADPRRRFAIVLDGEVVSAPVVAEGVGTEGLSPSAVTITIGGGDDQQGEAEDLATVLRYGALPATFETDRVEAVSASLGDDSLRAGLIAGVGGLILVGLALLLYYRALGLIAIAGLSVFGSLLLFLFSFLGETQGVTLTLAGVAGIVVSIGITSDSYIVYFERIKEEVRNGRSVRAAVDNGFRRAFRTILTADAVSLFGAILLFLLAVGAVKGFAVALGLATVIDVIVAALFTRFATAYLVRTKLGDGGRFSIRGAVGMEPATDPAGAEA